MNLSPAEDRTVELLAGGMTPQQIAVEMGVKVRTVRQRIRDARLKFGVETTSAMVAEFVKSRNI